MIEEVFAAAGSALSRCAALAYSAGPGSFTGLRVAAAVAQGLAYGAGIDVAPIGTLAAIAHSVVDPEASPGHTVLVAQDARMGEIYWALFERTDRAVVPIAGPALDAPAALRLALSRLPGSPIVDLGCGNAWTVHGAALDGLVARVVHRDSADAVDVAHLGRVACLRGGLVAPHLAQPIYVRNDVARTTAEREAARAAPLRSGTNGA